MTTDFSYNGKQIVSSGPFKPGGKDMPSDARTRVECYADIASIPNPYVGLKITVKADETNNNKMTDYIVKSLKANASGIANSVVDQVQRYIDYLGVSGGSSGGGSGEGLTTEQAEQLQTAYEHSQSTHVTSDDLLNIDAVSLNGKKFSEPMTKAEYDAIINKDSNTIYLVDDNSAIEGIPTYSSTVANKVLAVNSDGTKLVWSDPIDTSNFATKNQLSTIQNIIPSKTSQLTNDSNFVNLTNVNEMISNISTISTETIRNVTSDETFSLTTTSEVIKVTNISVLPQTKTCNKGDTFEVKVNITPNNATNKNYTLKSADNLICSVSGNTVTALDTGETDIIATSSNNLVAYCKVTVKSSQSEPIAVTGVSLDKTSAKMTKGNNLTLNATLTPNNATNKNVTWSTNNANCTVKNGVINAVNPGECIITVTTEDGSYSASCTITVSEAVIDSVDPILYWNASNSNMNDLTSNNNNGTEKGITYDSGIAKLSEKTNTITLSTINNWTNKDTNAGFEMYFKPYSILKADNKSSNFNNHFKRMGSGADNLVQFSFKYKTSDQSATYSKYIDTHLNNGEFNHVIITWDFADTSNSKIYVSINGEITTTSMVNFGGVDNSTFFTSLSLAGIQDLKFFKLYNKTLTTEEITNLFNSKDA